MFAISLKQLSLQQSCYNTLHARDNAEQFSKSPVQPEQPAKLPETKTQDIVTQKQNPLSQHKN